MSLFVADYTGIREARVHQAHSAMLSQGSSPQRKGFGGLEDLPGY
jgi:hypothetical protein